MINQRGVIHLLVPLVLLIGIIVGVYLVIEGPKIFNPKAGGGPIWFTDVNSNTLPVKNNIPQTTSPKVRIELYSTLGPPQKSVSLVKSVYAQENTICPGGCADSQGNGADGLKCDPQSWTRTDYTQCTNTGVYYYCYTSCSKTSSSTKPAPEAQSCPGGIQACGGTNYDNLGSCFTTWSYPGNPDWNNWCLKNAGGVDAYCYSCSAPAVGQPPPIIDLPAVTPAPVGRYTTSYRIAENPTDLAQALWLDYDEHPTIVNKNSGGVYEFKDQTPGVKFIWVEFKDAAGETDRVSAQINITSLTAPVTSPETSFTLVTAAQDIDLSRIVVNLYARSDIEAANLFLAKLKFPTDLLEVVSIQTDGEDSNQTAGKGSGRMCAQVITRACSNIDPQDCRDFPTLCDVPKGWFPEKFCKDNSQCPKGYYCPVPKQEPNPGIILTVEYICLPEVVTLPSSFIKNWVDKSFDNTSGTISIVGGVPDPGYQSVISQNSPLMAAIIFRAKKAGVGKITFGDDSAIFSNEDNINLLTIKRDLEVNFADPKPVPSAPPIPIGDGNKDGKVDLIDLSILLSDFNKISGLRMGIDMNGDGVINSFDISLMRNLLIQKGIIKG